MAELFLGDHFDETTLTLRPSMRTLCGHGDLDPNCEEGPCNPIGAVQGKVTTTSLARHLQILARMGFPCGEESHAAAFLTKHSVYAWEASYLRDMDRRPWTLSSAGEKPALMLCCESRLPAG